MTAPAMTIKIRAGHRLMERIQEASRGLDIAPTDFIEFAIENELSRQEASQQQEQATLQALQARVLETGETVSFHHDAETEEHATCQLCLRVIPRGPGVEGPLLCPSCHALAKGHFAAP